MVYFIYLDPCYKCTVKESASQCPCKNGGTCTYVLSKFLHECKCAPGWFGKDCTGDTQYY